MALDTAALNAAADAAAGLVTHLSLHSGFPATSGNELAVTRKAVTWGAASGGATSITAAQTFSDVPAGVTVSAHGYWSALTAGTCHGGSDVTDEAYAAAGTYVIDSETITVS